MQRLSALKGTVHIKGYQLRPFIYAYSSHITRKLYSVFLLLTKPGVETQHRVASFLNHHFTLKILLNQCLGETMSCVMCHMSRVKCHLSCATCQVSLFNFYFYSVTLKLLLNQCLGETKSDLECPKTCKIMLKV